MSAKVIPFPKEWQRLDWKLRVYDEYILVLRRRIDHEAGHISERLLERDRALLWGWIALHAERQAELARDGKEANAAAS